MLRVAGDEPRNSAELAERRQRRSYAKLATFDDNKQLKTFTVRIDAAPNLTQIIPLGNLPLWWVWMK